MGTATPPTAIPPQLLATVADQSRRLAEQLRSDAASLRGAELSRIADSLRQCAAAAEGLAEAVRISPASTCPHE